MPSHKFPQQVTAQFDGMVKNHAGTGETHHLPDTLFHIGTITMSRAFGTNGFIFSVSALVKSESGISEEFPAIGT